MALAVQAARRGDGWLALTALFGLLALMSFVFVAITIYVLLIRREKSGDPTDSPGRNAG